MLMIKIGNKVIVLFLDEYQERLKKSNIDRFIFWKIFLTGNLIRTRGFLDSRGVRFHESICVVHWIQQRF